MVRQRSRPRTANVLLWVALPLLAAPLLTPRMATAGVPPIEWHAPAGCGTEREVTLAVGRLLRADGSDFIHERFVAEIVEESVGSWKLTLRGFSSRGNWTRTLTGTSCIELREASKVMIALAIAPSRAVAIVGQAEATNSTQLDATGSPPGTAPSTASAAPATATANVSPPISSGNAVPSATSPTTPVATTVVLPTRLIGVIASRKTKERNASANSSEPTATLPASGMALIARTGVAVGVLPKPTPLIELGGLFGIGHLQLAGYVGWLFAQTRYSSDDPSKGARVKLGFAAAELGYAWLQRPLELNAHARLQVGVMFGDSKGVDGGRPGVGPYSSMGGGFVLAYPAESPWSAVLSADGWVSYISPEFEVSGVGRVYQPSLLGGVFGLGLRARLE